MTLPADIARCYGVFIDSKDGETCRLECVDCARRIQGIHDYVNGAVVWWMEPNKETPCPERMEYKA